MVVDLDDTSSRETAMDCDALANGAGEAGTNTANSATGVSGEADRAIKVGYEEGTDRLLGVPVLGPHAENLVQIAAAVARIAGSAIGRVLDPFTPEPDIGHTVRELLRERSSSPRSTDGRPAGGAVSAN